MPPVKSIEDQIAEMLKSSISDNDIEAILKSEAARLKGLIEKYINEYYASYDPVKYNRTDSLRNGVRVNTEVKNRSIDIYFDDDTVWGPSVKNPRDGEPWGFTPILIDAGWSIKTQKPIRKHMFDYYEGYHFLQSALDEFQKNNPYDLHVEVIVTPHASSEFSSGFRLRSDHRDMYDNMGF